MFAPEGLIQVLHQLAFRLRHHLQVEMAVIVGVEPSCLCRGDGRDTQPPPPDDLLMLRPLEELDT
ncbi:MAG: hypothetical protein NTW02_03840 [Cyanobium sp. LacPavin_0920_WC12_MAG_62_9]|nr:hypothetical protein [Cyanobium sp. LacPavin_0920_WC12_MAG_62_9]